MVGRGRYELFVRPEKPSTWDLLSEIETQSFYCDETGVVRQSWVPAQPADRHSEELR